MNDKRPEATHPESNLIDATTRQELPESADGVAAVRALVSSDNTPTADAAELLREALGTARQQLPYYADGPWDQPQYYETIQSNRRAFPKTYQFADINGDGRDEMIARGPGGIHVNAYDADTGQWIPMADGPWMRDDIDWNQPQYYQTILLADVDGDGCAEIIGRGGEGIEIYRYDESRPDSPQWTQLIAGGPWNNGMQWFHPQYYTTIQCADINNDGRAEIIGRGGQGLEAYTYDRTTKTLVKAAPFLSAWSDDAGWNKPEYYATIQCADIDKDGVPEVIGRGVNGIEVYKLNVSNPQSPTWNSLAKDNLWPDTEHWNQPESYITIQCADLDGDGRAEILGRGIGGLEAWQFNPATSKWGAIALPFSGWSNGMTWNQPEYYQTIQCADIDGDGRAEIIGRGGGGMEAYKFDNSDPKSPKWSTLIVGGIWSDNEGWNQVQHYITIQSARVLKPGDRDYKGKGQHTQSVIMGRGRLSMQAYRFDNSSPSPAWTQTSAPPPTFTTTQQTAYEKLNHVLGNRIGGEIRASYNNQGFLGVGGTFASWQRRLYKDPQDSYDQPKRPNSSIDLPEGITQDDWNTVTWQIYWELEWLQRVYDWYGPGKMAGLIDKDTIAQVLTLQDVGSYLSIDPNSTAEIILTILALIGSGAAAILTGGASLAAEAATATALGVASAVAGGLSGTFSAIPGLLPGGGDAFKEKYNQLQKQIDKSFTAAIKGNGALLFGLTGGLDRGTCVAPDYGRLKLIGEWIGDGTWSWTTGSTGGTTSDLVLATARGYATYIWKVLYSLNPWYTHNKPGFDPPASGFPPQYRYGRAWLSLSNYWPTEYPPISTMDALFKAIDPKVPETFPLEVSLRDFYQNLNGWATLHYGVGQESEPPPRPPLEEAIEVVAELSLDAVTGEVVAAVNLRNRGVTTAGNVMITKATLGGQSASALHANVPLCLHQNQPRDITVHFPRATQGTETVLKISGTYLGGTFEAGLPVMVP